MFILAFFMGEKNNFKKNILLFGIKQYCFIFALSNHNEKTTL